MRLIQVIFILFFALISCNEEDNEQIPVSKNNEILSLILELNSVEYQTEIQGTTIQLKNKLPFDVEKVRIKSLELSIKATSNVNIGEEINISTGNYQIVVMAEDQTTKIYNLLVKFDQEQFTVVEYEPVSVSKTYPKPVYVHYMPWFQTPDVTGYWGGHWTMANRNPNDILSNGRRDIASHYYPLVEPYDSNDPDYLEYALTCIKLSGIDGILIDYYGTLNFNDYSQLLISSNSVIDMCQKVGLKFGIVYEDRTIQSIIDQGFGNKIDLAKGDLKYMDENYFHLNNYFKLNEKPVLLNFGPITLKSNEDWLNVFSSIDTDINFFPLAYHPQYFNLTTSVNGVYAWVGEVRNNNLYNYSQQFDFTGGGAMFEFREFYEEGGWGATGQSDIPNRNGDLFKETLEIAKTANVDFIQLITWNDWGEGTAIEPSKDYGFHQLTIVQEFVGIESNPSNLELAVKLYQKRKMHKNKELENKKLDQVFYYLISLQLDKARELINEL